MRNSSGEDAFFTFFFTVLLLALMLIIGLLSLVWRGLRFVFVGPEDEAVMEDPEPQLGLFGAPASNALLDAYEGWLGGLGERLAVSFIDSPESIMTGSLIIGSLGGAVLARAANFFLDWPFWPVFFILLVINLVLGWLYSRPAEGWWELHTPDRPARRSGPGRGAFTLGRRIDE